MGGLAEVANAKAGCDPVIYWLFFSTNHIRGLEAMKRAMWSVDRSGSFEFSDKFATSLGRLFDYEDDDLARDLYSTFSGKHISVADLQRFVLTETPSVNLKGALEKLQREDKLRPVNGKQARKYDFSDPNLIRSIH